MRTPIRRHALPFLVVLLFGGPALAQGPGYDAEGSFAHGTRAASASMKVIVLDAPDAFAASFQTATRGCAGAVGMLGKATGKAEIVFTKKDELGGLCTIAVRFGPDFKQARVSESGCLAWHGAACDFQGELKRVGP